ncbi:MAG: hypothetical protein ACJA2N_002027, partial [Salibacteraceae bacterium]
RFKSNEIEAIALCVRNENGAHCSCVSYYYLMGDTGVVLITKGLPVLVAEIRLGNCGIADIEATEI